MKTKLKAIWESAAIYATIMSAALLAICIIFGWIVTICLCMQVSVLCLALLALYPPALIALKKVLAYAKAKWGEPADGGK